MDINWVKLRIITYVVGLAFGIVGVWLASKGLATYDQLTGTIDIAPISVDVIVSFIGQVLPSGVALTAILKGWRT